MEVKGAVGLVTGANRGIGKAFVRALLDHGAPKVYAGARDPASVGAEDGVIPLRLDVTRPDDVEAAASTASDVGIVINNAGVFGSGTVLEGSFDDARPAFEVNFFGTWAVSRAFAPVLARNGGGALVNMLSVASWVGRPDWAAYAASKAAQWSLTQAFRQGLAAQGTLVVGVHSGFVDTDLAAFTDAPKSAPADVAELAIEGVEADALEVLTDEATRKVKAALSGPPVV
jgi:NAD(P)-dependent dehydrogenase (short-subunit alcohol dehydrogenase family)